MDKFRMMFQFLQSNQESFMNGICGIMALASAQLYSAFEFSCPCIPEYNYAYGIGLLVVPPIWFFLLGFVLNNNISVLAEEWRRPPGRRQKDPTILRYMFCSITQRSLIAPAVWIAVTLMDGKSFLCAFSIDLDIHQYGNATLIQDMSEVERIKLLAKIPCKNIFDQPEVISREAAARYIKCISQIQITLLIPEGKLFSNNGTQSRKSTQGQGFEGFGWVFLLLMTLVAFLIRAIRPCFTQAAFLKTKYWSHYIDIERKTFDETCKEHAKSFAKICVQQYFESISGDMRRFHRSSKDDSDDDDDDKKKSDEDKLLGIRAQEDMNKVLWNWHTCKPPLALRKDQPDGQDSDRLQEEASRRPNGHANGHTHEMAKKEWAVYYSKV